MTKIEHLDSLKRQQTPVRDYGSPLDGMKIPPTVPEEPEQKPQKATTKGDAGASAAPLQFAGKTVTEDDVNSMGIKDLKTFISERLGASALIGLLSKADLKAKAMEAVDVVKGGDLKREQGDVSFGDGGGAGASFDASPDNMDVDTDGSSRAAVPQETTTPDTTTATAGSAGAGSSTSTPGFTPGPGLAGALNSAAVRLEAMGFRPEEVSDALVKAGGDEERALDILLGDETGSHWTQNAQQPLDQEQPSSSSNNNGKVGSAVCGGFDFAGGVASARDLRPVAATTASVATELPSATAVPVAQMATPAGATGASGQPEPKLGAATAVGGPATTPMKNTSTSQVPAGTPMPGSAGNTREMMPTKVADATNAIPSPAVKAQPLNPFPSAANVSGQGAPPSYQEAQSLPSAGSTTEATVNDRKVGGKVHREFSGLKKGFFGSSKKKAKMG